MVECFDAKNQKIAHGCSNRYVGIIASCSPLSKSLFGGKNDDFSKNSDGFERWLLFLLVIFAVEKDQILIQA
jgi:hypothetical protein